MALLEGSNGLIDPYATDDKPVMGYLQDLDADPEAQIQSDFGDTIEFQYNPDEITVGIGFQWNEQAIPGHSHPHVQPGAGGAKTYSFKLEFYNDSDDKLWVRKRTLWLQSLCYYDYDEAGNQKSAPHRVLFVFGQSIRAECRVRPFNYKLMGPMDRSSLAPRRAECPLVLMEVPAKAVGFRQVRP